MPLDRELKVGDSGDPVKALQAAIGRLPDTPQLKKLRDDRSWVPLWQQETQAASYAKGTEAAVEAIQQDANLPATGALDLKTVKAINDVIAQVDNPPGALSGRVEGRVLDASGRGVAGLDVTLTVVSAAGVDQPPIGTAKSQDGGDYAISFKLTPAQVTAQRVGNLRVAVTRDSKPVARSEVLINAPPITEGFDLVADAKAAPVGSDFDRVLADARAMAAKTGIVLQQLQETDEKPQASLFAAEAGQDPVKIALVAAALALEQQTKGAITAELAYGLASQGVPLGLLDLAGVHPDLLAPHVDRAIELGIVSAQAKQALQPAVEAARVARSQAAIAALRAGPAGERFLKAVGGGAQADKFFALAAQHEGPADAFWKKVADDPALKPAQDSLRFVAVTSLLIGDHAASHAILQQARDAGEIANPEGLAEWTSGDWLRRLQAAQATAPGIDPQASAEEKAAALDLYARRLDHLVEAAWPAPYAGNRIAASSLATKAKVAEFLKAAPDFDLRHQRLGAYLAAKPQAAGGLASETRNTIEALGRTLRVARRIEPALAMVANGLHSARSIAGLGPKFFARKFAQDFGGEDVARRAHARARHATALSTELYVQAAPRRRQTSPAVMVAGGVPDIPSSPDWASMFGHADGCACEHCEALTGPAAYLVDVLQFLKNRKTRLGDPTLKVLCAPGRRLDLTEIELSCENTDTILPYVDLVNEILEDAVAPPPPFTPASFAGPIVLTPGTDRLPDPLRKTINQALSLSADDPFAISASATLQSLTDGKPWAAATPAWRIEDDLATYAIGANPINSLTIASRSRQTRGSSSERLVSPQYINHAAYAKLSKAVYPWTLPYDQPRTEARAVLGKLETTLADVMEAFAPGDVDTVRNSMSIALERLGLSPDDAIIVAWDANPPPTDPWRYWGFSAATLSAAASIPNPTDATTPITTGGAWSDVLGSRVDVLLDRGRLTYAQLLALLDTLYVNRLSPDHAKRSISIVSTDALAPDTCDTSKLSLQGFDADAAIRVTRIARLAQRCGLSFADIDEALLAFRATDIDRPFLLKLAQAVRLNARYDGDLERLFADFVPLEKAALLAYWAPAGAARSVDQSVSGGGFRPTLYQRIFLAPGLVAAAGTFFPSGSGTVAPPR